MIRIQVFLVIFDYFGAGGSTMLKLSDSDKHERSKSIARAQAVRKERGISIEEIANFVGVSAWTFRRWENGSYEASPTSRQLPVQI